MRRYKTNSYPERVVENYLLIPKASTFETSRSSPESDKEDQIPAYGLNLAEVLSKAEASHYSCDCITDVLCEASAPQKQLNPMSVCEQTTLAPGFCQHFNTDFILSSSFHSQANN